MLSPCQKNQLDWIESLRTSSGKGRLKVVPTEIVYNIKKKYVRRSGYGTIYDVYPGHCIDRLELYETNSL